MSGRYEYQRESRFERHARTVAIVVAVVLLGLSVAGLAIHSIQAHFSAHASSIATQPQ